LVWLKKLFGPERLKVDTNSHHDQLINILSRAVFPQREKVSTASQVHDIIAKATPSFAHPNYYLALLFKLINRVHLCQYAIKKKKKQKQLKQVPSCDILLRDDWKKEGEIICC